jgi:hypothetical protein
MSKSNEQNTLEVVFIIIYTYQLLGFHVTMRDFMFISVTLE